MEMPREHRMSMLFRVISQRNDRIRRLEAALRWYAERRQYHLDAGMDSYPVLDDRGQRARNALKETTNERP